MRARIIYREQSEQARAVDEFIHEYERRLGRTVETIDPDTPEGADICRLYGIVEYPTVLATANDGSLLQMWRGVPLPLIDEVSYYDQAN
ncbi:MAG: hypothetical protein ACTJG2_00160 [Candidatus Saccharimonadales bacterium]